MTTPRKKLIDPAHRLHYHITSRCVRRSFLCGKDPSNARDYSHRKQWFIDRIKQLVPCFALNLEAYAIMSNHFHLIIDYDPNASASWSNEEVVERWLNACPPKRNGKPDELLRALRYEILVRDPVELKRMRRKLGSISTFMQWLKQPISLRSNVEDGCKGHFFEQRFWSGAILDEAALLASMAYVDLNPVRAKIADRIEACAHTSIHERLTAQPLTAERLAESLAPLVSGLEESAMDETDGVDTSLAISTTTRSRRITLAEYIERLEVLIASPLERRGAPDDAQRHWINEVTSLGKKQRAYGEAAHLTSWLKERALRALEQPLPQ